MAIRVALFNGKQSVKYVEFDALPLESKDQYRSTPPMLPWETVREISIDLAAGRVEGWAGQARWYRQAGGEPTSQEP